REAIPRENPKGQLEFYRGLTDMLVHAAPEVRLSWSRDGGEGPRHASGLIGSLPKSCDAGNVPSAPGRLITAAGIDNGQLHGGPVVEADDDRQGIPYTEGEVELPGGADFFRLQAACPMLAYVRWRLGAKFPAMPGPFASPMFRGILMHEALHALYQHAEDGGAFPQTGEIAAAVAEALSRLGARQRLGHTAWLAETGRLERVLREWLDVDGERSGFEVEALESGGRHALGRAFISVRLDRLDRMPDGRLFLIDYKSGKGPRRRTSEWVRSRMQEPQLPLYAALLEAQGNAVGGIAIGQVRTGECGFDGITDEAGHSGDTEPVKPAPGLIEPGQGRPKMKFRDWRALMSHWQAQSRLLCEEILDGCAENRVYEPGPVAYSGLDLILRHESTEDPDDDR
ncbi:MAG: PD-(D/E)XK nuclease family protein, partial [Xanthomonadales bacterium]|nr:PD-(D/E)XK nuclease family protein [Xanthomonadales bacterium]